MRPSRRVFQKIAPQRQKYFALRESAAILSGMAAIFFLEPPMPLRALLFLIILILPLAARVQPDPTRPLAAPAEQVAQTFNPATRSQWNTYQSDGVSVQFAAPDLEWSIIASPDAAGFAQKLSAADSAEPLDLVFPVSLAPPPNGNQSSDCFYPGGLVSDFTPLALPAPGLELRLSFDNFWSVNEVAPRSGSQSYTLSEIESPVCFESSGVTYPLAALNPHLPSSAAPIVAFTSGFGSHAIFARMQSGPGAWILLRPQSGSPWKDFSAAQSLDLPFLLPSNRRLSFSVAGQWDQPPSTPPANNDILLFHSGPLPKPIAPGSIMRLTAPAFDSDPPPTLLLGGLLPIIRADKYIGPEIATTSSQRAELPFRPDLAPCFTGPSCAYNWIGLSRRQGRLFFGAVTLSQPRAAAMHPAKLAELLEGYGIDHAAICAAAPQDIAIRWQGQWLGGRARDPGNIRAALCLRLKQSESQPRWSNVVRNSASTINARNAKCEPGLLDALRDGMTAARPQLDTFWWATVRQKGQPMTLDFDLQRPYPIYWLQMYHAEAAGFSSHFNLRHYRWLMRDSPTQDWSEVYSTDADVQGRRRLKAVEIPKPITRHLFDHPISARWWRLEIPDQDDPDAIPRIAEIEIWTVLNNTLR